MLGIKNKDLFPLVNYSMNTLTSYHLEYHLRGISTAKGIKELEIYHSNNFKELTELEPHQIPDLKALMGDSSDNIKGIDGIGINRPWSCQR